MPIVYSFSNNKGLKKLNNEDAVDVSKNKDGDLLSIICDGVSSHKSSGISSNYFVKELADFWKKSSFKDIYDLENSLVNYIKFLNEKIVNKSLKNNMKMATTIVVTAIYKEYIFIANVGDSLTYSLNINGDMNVLTKDDSFSGALLEAGVITLEEAKKHPKRHILNQALGTNDNIIIHKNIVLLNDVDYLISCSDGLTTMLTDEEISDIVINNELSVAIKLLIDKANNLGGVDNISIVIFKILRGDNNDR